MSWRAGLSKCVTELRFNLDGASFKGAIARFFFASFDMEQVFESHVSYSILFNFVCFCNTFDDQYNFFLSFFFLLLFVGLQTQLRRCMESFLMYFLIMVTIRQKMDHKQLHQPQKNESDTQHPGARRP